MGIIILLFIMLVIYFIPTFVASDRKTLNKEQVMVVNLFLGWTLLGWVIALAMAYSHKTKCQ